MLRHVRRGTVLAVAVLALGACQPIASSSSAGSTPAAGGATARTGGATTSHAPDAFQADVDKALQTLVTYWTKKFRADGRTFTPVDQIIPYTGNNGPTCGDSRLDADNAAYCTGANFIGYDVNFLRSNWRSIGRAFVYYVLGHEYGHAVQDRLGLTASVNIKSELQADCFSGAYLRGEIDAHDLALRKGDLDAMMAALDSVADPAGTPWFDPDAHGTATERKLAFFDGYALSVRGCTTGL